MVLLSIDPKMILSCALIGNIISHGVVLDALVSAVMAPSVQLLCYTHLPPPTHLVWNTQFRDSSLLLIQTRILESMEGTQRMPMLIHQVLEFLLLYLLTANILIGTPIDIISL